MENNDRDADSIAQDNQVAHDEGERERERWKREREREMRERERERERGGGLMRLIGHQNIPPLHPLPWLFCTVMLLTRPRQCLTVSTHALWLRSDGTSYCACG